MAEFILFSHDDGGDTGDWAPYLEKLRTLGVFRGGSAMGGGVCARKAGPLPALTPHLAGYLRIDADDLAHARVLLEGHPTYEAGGTVEIRELPRTS